jgi:hypothetical protein
MVAAVGAGDTTDVQIRQPNVPAMTATDLNRVIFMDLLKESNAVRRRCAGIGMAPREFQSAQFLHQGNEARTSREVRTPPLNLPCKVGPIEVAR